MKELITAMNISEARKAGLRGISVPPGALITPQARDDARSYGIALVVQEEPVPASIRAGATAVAPPRSPVPSVLTGLGRELSASAPAVEPPMPAPSASVQPVREPLAEPDGAGMAEAVLRRLNALLAPRGGIAAFPGLDATIASIIAEYSGGAASMPAAAQFSGLAGVPGVDVVRLAEQKNIQRVQGEVEVEEALVPGPRGEGGPGVTRFSWSGSSFAWTFEFDEVLTVTSGRIEVKSPLSPMAGLVLTAGEALRVRAGTNLTLTAKGDASCICSSWPAGK